MSLIDISPLVSPRIAVWPGDTPFTRTVNLSMAGGANLDLSHIQTSVHVGAHADAPSHYAHPAPGIADRPLERYYGPCQVFDVTGRAPGSRLLPGDLDGRVSAPRILLATGSFPDPDRWNEDFVSLSPELVDSLARSGVTLVGIDTPSVDPMHDRELLSHQRLAAHDMAVLEGLVLAGVQPGLYTLIALPLRLEGADASPVRAALAPLP